MALFASAVYLTDAPSDEWEKAVTRAKTFENVVILSQCNTALTQ